MATDGAAGLELLTPSEMGEADALAGALIPSMRLMENAGWAVARAASRRFAQRPRRTLVLCGPGGNGGDGYVAARLLARRGWRVATAALSPPRPGSDAAAMAARWRGERVAFGAAAAAAADLVIDAVFGAGFRDTVDDAVAGALAAARAVLAVDVPSGIDGATGEARGRVRQADATVTFFRLKPGHLIGAGRAAAGVLELAEIGLPAAVLDLMGGRAPTWRNEPGLWRLRAAEAGDHKYARGTVSVCGGAVMSGAARLAAAAARRGGAGLVRIAALDGGALYRSGEPGLVVDDGELAPMLEDPRRLVWVCGPGLTEAEAERCLPVLLGPAGKTGRQVVVDAGALAVCAGDPARLAGAAVLTPHEGEFSRVFVKPGADPLGAARAAARLAGAVVVLKGATTIIAAPDGRAALNVHATPALATAGTGDTLAGLVGAMLAQGLAPFEAASAAAWLHGEAGLRAGPGLIAEDLAELLPAAMAEARRRGA